MAQVVGYGAAAGVLAFGLLFVFYSLVVGALLLLAGALWATLVWYLLDSGRGPKNLDEIFRF